MATTQTQPLFPRLDTLLWLLATLVLVVLPHMSRMVIWLPPLFFALLLWRYQIAKKQWQLPNFWLLFSILLLALLGLFLSYGFRFGRDGSVTLLIILCGLKLLETKTRRDVFFLCFLSYFLIITNFLYSQTIPTALYMSLVTLVATATLISLNDENQILSTRQRLRLSSILLMQALPVMLVLFFLFPRVAGPFWKLPLDSGTGVTGLSDSMSIGDVRQLTLSDEVAFRVKGELPPPEQRYWRGPVLWWTNGRDWKSGFQQHQTANQLNIHPSGESFDYTVTLEPHNERWLFALEMPVQAPTEGSMTPDYRISAKRPVRERIRYKVRSYTRYRADFITDLQRRFALGLPEGKHPRARALAAQWRQEVPEPEALVKRALQYFNELPFVYTYTPDLLLNDPIDEFLFETRNGFCEHYAAAFTVLMRAAGVPARVVTGYLGGNLNPIGNYLIVRQRDAHAWSEIWLPDKGWTRIDPTNAVAPTRVEQGIESALPTAFNPLNSESPLLKIWQHLGNRWDAINNGWNQWILGYGPTRQREFLSSLGLKNVDWAGMTMALIIIITSLLLGYAAWMFFINPQTLVRDPAQKIYLRFCRKLARQGLHRHSSEGPITFATRVSAARPDLAVAVQNIIELYVQTRYRSQFETVGQLRKAVLSFR